jgi:hypothetical protein
MPVRVRTPGKRWKRGHAVWVHDVFAFRGSPAAWEEVLEYVQEAAARSANAEEDHKLRGLDQPIIATLTTVDGRTFEAAASRSDRVTLLAPFDVDVVDDDVGSVAADG